MELDIVTRSDSIEFDQIVGAILIHERLSTKVATMSKELALIWIAQARNCQNDLSYPLVPVTDRSPVELSNIPVKKKEISQLPSHSNNNSVTVVSGIIDFDFIAISQVFDLGVNIHIYLTIRQNRDRRIPINGKAIRHLSSRAQRHNLTIIVVIKLVGHFLCVGGCIVLTQDQIALIRFNIIVNSRDNLTKTKAGKQNQQKIKISFHTQPLFTDILFYYIIFIK